MNRKMFLIALAVLISIPFAIFPSSTDAGRKDKVILWTRFLGEGKEFGGRSPLLDKKNKRLFISSPREVVCFNSTNGKLVWQRLFEGDKNSFLTGNLAFHKGNVIFGNSSILECMSQDSGKSVWSTSINVTSNIEAVSDTIYLASGNNIFKIDARTGKSISIINIPDKNNYSFVTFVEKDRIVVSTSHGMRKLIDLAKEIVVWESNSNINKLLDKPQVCGKYLVLSGYLSNMEWMLFVDILTGNTAKKVSQANVCFDVTDGRILTSYFCYDAQTLEPVWKSDFGFSRLYDCFDSVFFTDYNSIVIQDWNGNKSFEKKTTTQKLKNPHFDDRVWTKPASYDGKYFLLTTNAYLVCWGIKPDIITYTSGNDYITADGKEIKLEHKPFQSEDGKLMVDPRGFLEPLGWVASHDDAYSTKWVVFHDYEKQIAMTIPDSGLYTHDIDKIVTATTTDDGTLMIPFETMVSQFGLTMTKDGDKYKFSYPSK